MALIHVSKRRDFIYALEEKAEGQAPSFAELIHYGAKFGLRLGGYKVQDPREILTNKDFPLLVSVYENGFSHMLYLYKAKRKSFLVLDPKNGKREIEKADFIKIFDGRFLKVEEYNDIYPKIKPIHPISALSLSFHSLLNSLPSISLLLSIFSMNGQKENFILSLLLLLSSFLFLLLSKLETSLFIKRFDSLYLNKVDDNSLFKRRENYMHYNKYKSMAFVIYPTLILNILEILLTLFIFSFGDPYFFFSLVSSILFSLLLYFLFVSKEDSFNEKASSLEYSYFHFNKSEKNRLLELHSLSKVGKRYSVYLTIKDSASIIFACLASFFALYFKNDLGMELFFFTFISNYLMIGLIKQSLTNYDKLDEKKKEESYFIFNFLS